MTPNTQDRQDTPASGPPAGCNPLCPHCAGTGRQWGYLLWDPTAETGGLHYPQQVPGLDHAEYQPGLLPRTWVPGTEPARDRIAVTEVAYFIRPCPARSGVWRREQRA